MKKILKFHFQYGKVKYIWYFLELIEIQKNFSPNSSKELFMTRTDDKSPKILNEMSVFRKKRRKFASLRKPFENHKEQQNGL